MFSSKANFAVQRKTQRFLSLLQLFYKNNSNSKNTHGPAATMELGTSYKLYNLEEGPSNTTNISHDKAIELYRQMQSIRRFENACANLYRDKVIRGFCHLYVGQEACCVGIKSSMRPQDTVITSYRSHGWTWLMGVSIYELIAELCQKKTGCSRAKGGSMHTYARNFYGGNGIVAAQVPLGTGIALAHAYRRDGGVNFACYGDGGANQGQLFEAFNMACLWNSPVVFVCENNRYSMGTSTERHACSTDFYTRGDYIPGLWVDGSDVLAVQNATNFVINFANTCGPILMELETYRYVGHSMSDPGTSYRTREEVQIMREKNDPITKFKEFCLKNKIINEEEFQKVDNAIKKEVTDAVNKSAKDKEPELDELVTDVYANNLHGVIRNLLSYNLKHKNVGKRFVAEEAVKPTPKSEINETSKEEKVKGQEKKISQKETKISDEKSSKSETKDKSKDSKAPEKKK